MKSRKIKFVAAAIIVSLIIFLILHQTKRAPEIDASTQSGLTNTTTNPTQKDSAAADTITNFTIQMPDRSASPAEWGAWERAMNKRDPYWDYRLPILFYGKVVDDNGQPISGASIAFSWTDLSSEGTSQKNTTSDSMGLFSLAGVTGKSLTVFASKQGYQHYYSKNQFRFDYSPLANPDKYYAPDSKNPTVFILRKNQEAEQLIEYSEKRVEVQQGQSTQFNIGPNGITLLFERMTNDASTKGGWISRVSVPGGGLTLTTEEFPYEAPKGDYLNFIIITNGIPRPPNWPSDYGAMLYFMTPQGYGRVMIRYISNMDRMFVTSWFNPNNNSRNLEIDPNKIQVMRP